MAQFQNSSQTHYHTLDVSQSATQAEIKKAYRRLAKLFHPDSNRETADHTKIARINAAYEVLGDPQRRQSYDKELQFSTRLTTAGFADRDDHRSRQQRTQDIQNQYQKRRQTEQNADEQLKIWLNQVYTPVSRRLHHILSSLQDEIDELAADPFDDELMEGFQAYLENCRDSLSQAQGSFRSMPNPAAVAGAAANLYYCLNQVGDGLDELERFTTSYDDHYIHTGQELFRIAVALRREAQAAVREMGH